MQRRGGTHIQRQGDKAAVHPTLDDAVLDGTILQIIGDLDVYIRVDLEKRANNLGKPVGSHAVKASNPYCTAIQGQEPLYRALQLSLSSADRTDLGDQIFSLRCQGHTCPIPNEERNTPLPL